jgi:hypothetical protein
VLGIDLDRTPQPPAAGQEERLRSQSLRRSTQTPTVPRILEYPEPVAPVMTVPNPEQVEGLTPTATPYRSRGYSPASETTSQTSSTSTRSGVSGPVGNLSRDLSHEKLIVISSDGQRIAFANQGRAKIFSKRPDDVALQMMLQEVRLPQWTGVYNCFRFVQPRSNYCFGLRDSSTSVVRHEAEVGDLIAISQSFATKCRYWTGICTMRVPLSRRSRRCFADLNRMNQIPRINIVRGTKVAT